MSDNKSGLERLHKIVIKKKNKFIMNSHNTDVSIDGMTIHGVREISVAVKASDSGNPALAETTLRLVGFVEFETASDAEIAADEAKVKAAQDAAKAAESAPEKAPELKKAEQAPPVPADKKAPTAKPATIRRARAKKASKV